MADKEYIESEATCKDCICYDVCFVVRHNGDDRVLRNSPCKHFRNKSDVVEVRHGHWILEKEPNGKPYCFHCSVCDEDFMRIDIRAQTPYCPYCGAKMDGKGEGE